MSISSLFDVLASHEPVVGNDAVITTPNSDDSTDTAVLSRLAGQMISSSLDSGRTLRGLRERMFPLSDDPASVEVANALREEFVQWVAEAEAVLERAIRVKQMGLPLPIGADQLEDMIGMTLAMLQISLDSHFQSLAQSRRGESISLAEVRRELRLNRHP